MNALPAILPGVVAEIVDGLPPRLRKRLDNAVRKAAAWPVERDGDGDTVRLTVDVETELVLHAPGGIVAAAEDVRCPCLLAPACLHRAAAVSAAPIAERPYEPDQPDHPDLDTVPDDPPDSRAGPGGTTPGAAPPGGGPGGAPPRSAPTDQGVPDTPGVGPGPQEVSEGVTAHGGPTGGGATAVRVGQPGEQGAADARPRDAVARSRPGPGGGVRPAAAGDVGGGSGAVPDDGKSAALAALRAAGAGVLAAGIDGAGAVVRAELLRGAHTARLSGLPQAAAAAVTVANGLRSARADEPQHRLADLAQAVCDLLDAASGGPSAATATATARRAYRPAGSLRLYGLFTEPVRTASGYAGVVTWTADAEGRLYTVGDVAPGGAARAVGAARRAVRIGDTAIEPSALSRAGLAVAGATVSPDGRLGAGSGVRAVRASGAAWTDEPLDHLWAPPPEAQVARALAADSAQAPGADLLFLDVTVLGAGGDSLLARCGPLVVRLLAADDHPELAHWDNLRLLAAHPGLRLRVIGRLERAAEPRLRLLAAGLPAPLPTGPDEGGPEEGGDRLTLPPDRHGRVDLGLDRLHHADLPRRQAAGPVQREGVPPAGTEAPLHLLRQRIERAVSGGRAAIALSGPEHSAADTARLRRAGLATAADLVDALGAAATDRGRNAFGRLLPADADRFARAWLAAALYERAVSAALCAHAWSPDPNPERERERGQEVVAATASPGA